MGGRTEVFDRGINQREVYHFDVPSMYGRCMLEELPYGNPVHVKIATAPADIPAMLEALRSNGYIGFFTGSASTPEQLHIPVLGVHHNGKLIFPLGNLKGT